MELKSKPLYIVGNGNVSNALFKGFIDCKIPIAGILGRERKGWEGNDFKQITSDIEDHAILFLAVSDSSILEVSERFNHKKHCVIHCSGSTPLKLLSHFENAGVFYPLQSFTMGRNFSWSEIPVFIEATNDSVFSVILHLAKCISNKVISLNSESRKQVHLAAVLTNNFINASQWFVKEYLENHGLQYPWLFPLLEETLAKIIDIQPENAQTGPAFRRDFSITQEHLEMLKLSQEWKEAYSQITKWLNHKT